MLEKTKKETRENEICKLTNRASVIGVIEKDFEFSHQIAEEKFYKTMVSVERLSKKKDTIPLIISSYLLEEDEMKKMEGRYVEITGSFRSHNNKDINGKVHLELFLYAQKIYIFDDAETIDFYKNEIYLNGYICKEPKYRMTPSGRQITDLMIGVNRLYGRSDYIPCITWGKQAIWSSKRLEIGDQVEIEGRIESREYLKKFSADDKGVYKTAYEISIRGIKKIAD